MVMGSKEEAPLVLSWVLEINPTPDRAPAADPAAFLEGGQDFLWRAHFQSLNLDKIVKEAEHFG